MKPKSSRTLTLLANLYDNTAQRLQAMVQAGKQPSDTIFKEQVVWLEQISKTIMAVYQIEKARAQADGMMPEEKAAPDPKNPNQFGGHNPNQFGGQPPGLGGIPSPGSWTP